MTAFDIVRLVVELGALVYFAGGLGNRVKQLEKRPADTEERLASVEAKVDLIVQLLMDGPSPKLAGSRRGRRDADAA